MRCNKTGRSFRVCRFIAVGSGSSEASGLASAQYNRQKAR